MARTPDPRVQAKKALLVLARDLGALRKKVMAGQLDPEDALSLTRYYRALSVAVEQHDEDVKTMKARFSHSSVAEVEQELVRMVAQSPALAAKMRLALQPKEATPCSPPAASDAPSLDET